ncbi:MAG TPA: NAD(P)H-binding protein [Terriglobales bacterium]|nr:NAD(P)H-binding protein [Terriglobales bacterium]
MAESKQSVFIAGGTGYLGRPLISRLLEQGHTVRALVRPGSERKLPQGCLPVPGNALDASSYAAQIAPADTFVQLVGVAHPSPSKGEQFRSIDFVSASGAIHAAAKAGVRHFVYLSVAHPAPMMKSYIAVRAECEALLQTTGMNATIVRPWYVLGPGHRWPYAIIPMYWLCSLIPATREGARRLGLVTLKQMTLTLANAVNHPAQGIRIVTVPQIRQGGEFLDGPPEQALTSRF